MRSSQKSFGLALNLRCFVIQHVDFFARRDDSKVGRTPWSAAGPPASLPLATGNLTDQSFAARRHVGQVGNLRPIGNRPLCGAANPGCSRLSGGFFVATRGSVLCATIFLLCLPAAASIDGIVVNRTTGQPQAGVTITVNKMNASSGMLNDNAGNAKTDAQGKFALPTSVDGPTLLRITWDGVTYSKMLPPGTPSSGLTIDVYNSSKNPGAAKVDKHMLLFEPGNGQMVVNETILVKNDGQTTWNDPKEGTVAFFVPADHSKLQIQATAPGPAGVNVPATATKSSKPDTYKVNFAVKPGETRLDLTYSVPYTMGSQYEGKIVTKDDNTYLIVPNGVTLAAENLTDLGQEPRTQAHIYGLPGTTYNIQLGGAEIATPDATQQDATQPDAAAGPQIETMMPRVLDKKIWILAFALGILGLGFALLYRKEANERGRG
jgi:hypothetical protein